MDKISSSLRREVLLDTSETNSNIRGMSNAEMIDTVGLYSIQSQYVHLSLRMLYHPEDVLPETIDLPIGWTGTH